MKSLLNRLGGFLKKVLAPGFEEVKGYIAGQIDWAIGKIGSGELVGTVVEALRGQISKALGAAHLPGPASMLVELALASVDWGVLSRLPAERAVAELRKLKLKVQGARL